MTGLRAELFVLGDLAEVALARDLLDEIAHAHPRLDAPRAAHELVRRLITRLIEDVTAETGRRLGALAPRSADDVRRAKPRSVDFSAAMAETDRAIKEFLLAAHVPARADLPHHGGGRTGGLRSLCPLRRDAGSDAGRLGAGRHPQATRRCGCAASPTSSPG